MSHPQETGGHEETRESILDAVGHLLGRFGYSKMTVEDIAREAGIGKGTLYLYFPSKLEAAMSWFDRSNGKLQAKLRKIAGSDLAPAERVRRILIERVMHRFDGAQSLVESLEDLFIAVRPSFFARRVKYHQAEEEILAEVLGEGKARDELACLDPQVTAHLLALATNSLLPYSLSASQLGRRKEIEAAAAGIAELVLTGLLRRSEAPVRDSSNISGDGH
jgi:AcrR family transcriptional regulator